MSRDAQMNTRGKQACLQTGYINIRRRECIRQGHCRRGACRLPGEHAGALDACAGMGDVIG
jgi:hypothetical protein